ncbi:MAG: phage/plasmid primase, P4 family [Chthoniobacter sp.]|nr:phage/plasmid primase, P4 family [Chthoniobacter sp.]
MTDKQYPKPAPDQVTTAAPASPLPACGRPPHLQHLYDLFGNDAILLACPRGQKGSRDKDWPKTTLEETLIPAYQARLAKENIAVRLGKNVFAIDFDDDNAGEEFLKLNPELASSLQSRGARGRQLWLKIDGEAPQKVTKLLDGSGAEIGEWRGESCSMIYGLHPAKVDYHLLVDAPPVTVNFAEINWPATWQYPGRVTEYDKLVQSFGEPFRVGGNGGVTLNQNFFAKKYVQEHDFVYDQGQGGFYEYGATTGVWAPRSEDALKREIFQDISRFAQAQDEDVQQPIICKANNKFLTDVIALLRGHAEQRAFFESAAQLLHVANGMIIPYGAPRLFQFQPAARSRNQCAVDYVQGAGCPQFHAFVNAILSHEDVNLLQKMFGYLLLPGNRIQKIFLLTGVSGSGKSTLVTLLENLVGVSNVGQLRTAHLGGRFEIAGFLGKSMLVGADAPADFLQDKSAYLLKSLVGDDAHDAELKNANERLRLRGKFNVVIASNYVLRIGAAEDASAWGRRLVCLHFYHPFPGQRIPKYADKLFREEGSGILNWALEGLQKVAREINKTGDFVLTEEQKERIDRAVHLRDPLRDFLHAHVERGPGNLSTQELVAGYLETRAQQDRLPEPPPTVAKGVTGVMWELFQTGKSHNIKREDTEVRGFRGVRWKAAHA